MSTRRFFAVALVVSLLVAGVASYYASSHPDGLEYVADSPLADYQTSGVDDARISGGLAGVIGVVVMLLLSTGLFWLVRRRGTDHADSGIVDSGDVDSDDARPERARQSEA